MNALATLGLDAIRAEVYLAIAALFLLLYGAYKAPRANNSLVLVSVLMLGLTGWLAIDSGAGKASLFSDMLISNAFTLTVKILILTASALALLLATGWLKQEGGRPFEYAVLVLLATLGMMFMVSANSLLVLYMALEMMSLALYVLASFDRDNKRSSEAGLKYFVLGSLASGMILFGSSLVYGFAGTVRFDALATYFSADADISRAAVVGLVMVIVGFCFKLSAVPFHMWSPDVYEGAPTPVTAFFATAPKVAAAALFVRFLYEPFGGVFPQWQQIVIAASVLSMIVGSLAAIRQTNIKRLLAYSSIGHVGFIFLGLAAGTQEGVASVITYLAIYVFMSAGMFACILLLLQNEHELQEIKDLAGLSKTRPWVAAAIAAFMFAMAGIPPLSGFFAKMAVLLAAINAGMFWLAVVGVIASVVGCYYYLKVVKVMYFDEPAVQFTGKASPLVGAVAWVGALVTVLFFLVPTPLMQASKLAAAAVVP